MKSAKLVAGSRGRFLRATGFGVSCVGILSRGSSPVMHLGTAERCGADRLGVSNCRQSKRLRNLQVHGLQRRGIMVLSALPR